MEQVENDGLVAFIVGRVYPTDFNKDSKRRLREKAASFLVIDGELHHKGFEGRLHRVVIGKDETLLIMRSLHADVVGGCHFGQNATTAKIIERNVFTTLHLCYF